MILPVKNDTPIRIVIAEDSRIQAKVLENLQLR